MAQTAQPTAPNYTKYEAMTDILAKDTQGYMAGLEDAVVRAWASHTGSVPANQNQGDGLADKIYNSADDFIRKEFYGGETPKNVRAQRLLEESIQSMIGFTAESLSGHYKGKKVVHYAEVAPIADQMKESIGKESQKDLGRALGQLKEADFEPFKGYVLKLAGELGLTDIKKDQMPRLSEVIDVYQKRIIQSYLERQESIKREEARKSRATSP